MKLLSFETSITKENIIRIEVHKYKDIEEVNNYKKLWEKAGFIQLLLTPNKDSFIVIYKRRLELR